VEERSQVRIRPTTYIFDKQTIRQILGCHVAAHDWATWHPIFRPNNCHVSTDDSSMPTNHKPTCVTCQFIQIICHASLSYALSTAMSLEPRHLLTSSMPRVTLSVVTCVTFGLAQLCAKKSKFVCHVSLPRATTCPIQTCHVSCMDLPRVLYGLATSVSVQTVRTAQSTNFCLFDFSDRMRYLLHTDSV
jgi:hypothetical protein